MAEGPNRPTLPHLTSEYKNSYLKVLENKQKQADFGGDLALERQDQQAFILRASCNYSDLSSSDQENQRTEPKGIGNIIKGESQKVKTQ